MDEEELPDKTLEYDEETLELTLPSGDISALIASDPFKAYYLNILGKLQISSFMLFVFT